LVDPKVYTHAYYSTAGSGLYSTQFHVMKNFLFTVTSTPLLKDLQNLITPHYATCWRIIGIQLGLSSGVLNVISHDNHHKAIACCNNMFEVWLEVDPYVSWEKLFKVTESPAVFSGQSPDRGD